MRERERAAVGSQRVSVLVSIQFGARIQQAGGGGGGGGFGERIGRFVSGRERIFEVG